MRPSSPTRPLGSRGSSPTGPHPRACTPRRRPMRPSPATCITCWMRAFVLRDSRCSSTGPHAATQLLRVVTAASLFDGHDAAINIMRRLIQAGGAEGIHLGHNRAVADVVATAIQEDAHAIAVSSYQGGHNEYFRYMVDLLRDHGASHIKVFAGGGGVIVPEEIRALEGAHAVAPEVETQRAVGWAPEHVPRAIGVESGGPVC